MTSATAGRAIFFSGMTVIVGLMGMLFFENTGLPSLGWGICATAVALTSSDSASSRGLVPTGRPSELIQGSILIGRRYQ